MSFEADFFLKKTLGDDFMESLIKVELWKPGTRTTIDHEEIRTALMIVPRTVMGLLINNLSSMSIGETKEVKLPVNQHGAILRATKHERDVFSGEIEQEGKRVVDFKYRSIPGIGLVVMSAFELYDTNQLLEKPQAPTPSLTSEAIQSIIDQRLMLHDLVGKIVDKKLTERDAIQQLILMKLSEKITSKPERQSSDIEIPKSVVKNEESGSVNASKKGSPLKGFLEKRERKKVEYKIQLSKGEQINCPDCGKYIFNENGFSGCVCYGDSGKIHIKKTEDGVKISFGKSWEPDNIEMLLEVLRSKNGK